MLTKRDFHGEEHYKLMLQQYEAIRVKRKAMKGKPDQYDRIELELDKAFEKFYNSQI